MAENPFAIYEKLDPEIYKHVQDTRKYVYSEGALPMKYKYLIALALDADHGAVHGVTTLAQRAMEAGVTKQEIAEALRITEYICGIGSLYTAANALKEIV